MKSIAIFMLVVMLPLVGCVGYVAHQNPALPSFDAYVGESQAVTHVAGLDSDEWNAMAITGPHKGSQMDLRLAIAQYPTHKDLERSANGKVVYVERRCVFYSTTGRTHSDPADKTLVQRCTQERKTRQQVEKYLRAQVPPGPTS